MVLTAFESLTSGFRKHQLSVPIAVTLSLISVTIDLQVSNVADFIHGFTTSGMGSVTFLLDLLLFWIAQTFLIFLVRHKIREIKFMGKEFKTIEKIIPTSFVLLLTMNVLLGIQVFLLHQYYVVYLIAITGLSYGLNIFLMSYLSYVLLAWHRRKHNRILIFYGISMIQAAISSALTLIFIEGLLLTKEPLVNAHSHVIFPTFNLNSIFGIINYLNTYLFMSAFIFVWIATILLFRQHYTRLGRLKFLLIVTSPLIFFVGQFFTLINFVFPFIDSSSLPFVFTYSIIFSFSSIIGSVIFGAGFWLLARSVSNKPLKGYLNMTGFGLIMFFTSATATIIQTPFPPFGIVAISLVGFSSYFVLYGLYSSAISISQDADLRKTIRRSTEANVRLLENIGIAQLQDRVETKVSEVAHFFEEELKAESGIAPSVTEQEIRNYIKTVIQEISDKREQKSPR